MEQERLKRLHSVASLLLRLAVAGIFVPIGVLKFVLYPDEVAFFAEVGVPFPEIAVIVVGFVEVVAGFAVLVGFLTRVSAVLLGFVMVGAFLTAGPDTLNLAASVLLVAVVLNGSGEYSALTEKELYTKLRETAR